MSRDRRHGWRTHFGVVVATAFLFAVPVVRPAGAQALDPPPLTASTYSAVLATQLEVELAHFDGLERSVHNETQRIVVRGSINVRLVAAELLLAADSTDVDHDAGSRAVSAVLGLTIAEGRADLDALLTALARELDRPADAPGPRPIDALQRALGAVDQFNERTVEHAEALRSNDPPRVDHAVAEIVEPLLEVVNVMEGSLPHSHWPVVSEGSAAETGATLVVNTVMDAVEHVAARAEELSIDPEVARVLNEMIDRLRSGANYAEFSRDVRALARQLDVVLRFGRAAAQADWAQSAWRSAWRHDMETTVLELAHSDSRSDGITHATQLGQWSRYVEAVNQLADAGAPVAPIGALLASWTIDDPVAGAEALSREGPLLMVVMEGMLEYRARAAVEVPRDLRAIADRFEARYDAAETALLAEIDQLAAPAAAETLEAHAHALDDLARLEAAPSWIELADRVNPGDRRLFGNTVRRWCQLLSDDARRDDALATMEAFADQAQRFVPMPFEHALRAADHDAVVVTGALQDEFIAQLDAAREEWITAWATERDDDFRGGAPAVRLEDYHRLTSAMAESVEVVRVRDDSSRLNAWSAWETPEGILERATADLPNRLKLATASAVQGDLDALADQLDRIDAELPVARLVGRLALLVGDALPPEPTGVHVILGQVAHPPPPESWLLDERTRLAEICRYLAEASHARGEGRTPLADEIDRFVNERAATLGR